MTDHRLAVVVLAAGMGTRMKSAKPKILHEVAGKAMLQHVLDSAAGLEPERTVVVIGAGMEMVGEACGDLPTVVQSPQHGTGHAVLCAREALAGFHGEGGEGTVLILYGDTPLLSIETLRRMRDLRTGSEAPALVALGFRPADPGAYGRMLVDPEDGRLLGVVEAIDADPDQLAIELCNGGLLLADGPTLFSLLDRVDNNNAKGEYYLTDVYGLAAEAGLISRVVEADEEELMGVNSRAELARVEAVMQGRLRAAAMAAGVTLIDPDTVWFSHDTRLSPDVVIEPGVFFGPGVTVEEGVRIRAYSHLEGAHLGAGTVVGPYARLRPGARLETGARVGNFVEVKNAVLEPGAKANHLTYIGDARVGAGANVGAGTITCNYDGFGKHWTEIGAGAFIGSNTALVAPIKVGDGAIVAAGSTISRDVSGDAIAIERADQKVRQGAAARFREHRGGAAETGGKPGKAKAV